ncbi:unnamed protein product [Adineta ricciae]|nr:unnamed protein product [Adineta ricciae]
MHACYMLISNLIEPLWNRRPVATTVLILWSMMDPTLSAASMPVLMSLCQKHVEGSQFTTYMSIVNLSDLLGAFISGQLQQFFPANVIGIGCGVLIIIALITVALSLWWSRKRLRKVKIEMKP